MILVGQQRAKEDDDITETIMLICDKRNCGGGDVITNQPLEWYIKQRIVGVILCVYTVQHINVCSRAGNSVTSRHHKLDSYVFK